MSFSIASDVDPVVLLVFLVPAVIALVWLVVAVRRARGDVLDDQDRPG